MKLNSCGHLFHYKCIFEWLNGTASNSNLCPECRIQFSEQRRPVRPVPGSVLASRTWIELPDPIIEDPAEADWEPLDIEDDDDDDGTLSSSSLSLDAALADSPEDASTLANASGRDRIVSIDYRLTFHGRVIANGLNDEDEDGVYGETYDDEWVIGSFGH